MKRNDKVLRFDGNYDFYMRKGAEYAKEGRYIKALRYLNGAAEKKPTDVNILLSVAQVYQKMGLYDMSNSALYTVLSKSHENQAACVMLGQNYSITGDSLRELYYLKNYSEIAEDVDLMEIFENTANFMPQYEQVYPMPSYHKEAVFHRAVKLMSEGRLTEAEECFNEILASYPEDAATKNHLCQIYLMQGKTGQAVDAATEILRKDDKNVFAWCNLAMALHFVGNVSQRNDAVRRIKALDVTADEDIMRVIKILCLTENFAEAFALAEKYIKKHPYDLEYLTFAAVSAYNAGMYEKAKAKLLVISAIVPSSVVIDWALAAAQDAMDGRPAPERLPFDLKLPAEEENRLKMKAAACDFSKVFTDDETAKLARWAVSDENLPLADIVLDRIIKADEKKAKKLLDNLLAQNCGWQLKRLVLEKRLTKFPRRDVYINKDGYFVKLDMPAKKPPQTVADGYWHAFSALSVFFVEDEKWVDKLSYAARLLDEKAEALASLSPLKNEVAAVMTRLAKPEGFDDKQICVVFRTPYNRLVRLTEEVSK